jgi:hypothetical protein
MRRTTAFAFGVLSPAYHGEHQFLDAVAEMMTSLLSKRLGRKPAATQ